MAAAQLLDVAVVGGGPIGLACAWRAAAARAARARARRRRARRVARRRGHARARLRGGVRRARAARARAAQRARVRGLLRRAGRGDRPRPGPARDGTLVVARDADEAEALDRLIAFRRVARAATSSGCARARRAAPSPRSRRRCGSRSTSPATTRSTRAGSSPRCARPSRSARAPRGARCSVERRARDRRRARGRRAPSRPAQVVVAAGVDVARLGGLPEDARVPVRPVKGQVLRLRDPSGPRPRRAHDPRRAGLPRPARRRPLRARRDDGGARLGHRRRPRAASTS